MHIITLRSLYSDAIISLKALGHRGPALRGALAAHIACTTPSITRSASHNIVRFMAIA